MMKRKGLTYHLRTPVIEKFVTTSRDLTLDLMFIYDIIGILAFGSYKKL